MLPIGVVVGLLVAVGAAVSVVMRPGTGKLPGGEAQVAAIDFDPPPSGTAAGQPAKPRPRRASELPNQATAAAEADQAAATNEPPRDEPPELAGDVPDGTADDANPVEMPPVSLDAPAGLEAEPMHLASIVALPAVAAGELDGGRGNGGQSIELGTCSEQDARGLTLDLAVPADGMGAEGAWLLVDRFAGDAPRWTIGWKAVDASLGDEKPALVATVAAADGRLRMALPVGEDALPGLAVLARSVLLVMAPDRSEPHEIRFVKPAAMGPVSADVFGKRPTKTPLPLPPSVGPAQLQRGGCRIDLEVAGETHSLHIDAGVTPKPATAECVVLELATGDRLGLRVEVDLPKAMLTIRPGVLGIGAKSNWLPGFASLAEGGAGAAARCLDAWDKQVEAICGLRLNDAIMEPDGNRIVAFFRESFRLPCGYPPLNESARSGFDRYVRNAVAQPVFRDAAPRSFDEWMDSCTQILANARPIGGGGPQLNDQWSRTFTQPLHGWWRTYRPELADAVHRLAADLAAARERAANVKVLRVVTVARVAAGAEYDVPLVRFDEIPHPGDDPPAQVPFGLD